MKEFYFTFGGNHYTLEGVKMRDMWVRVTAPDYNIARQHFCDHFAAPMMGAPDKWSFQYEEKDFERDFFPQGEYENLIAPVENTEKAEEQI